MRNLKKSLSLLIIFPVIILLFSFFAGKAGATACNKVSDGWKCPLSNFERTTYSSEAFCNTVCTDITPSPTSPPGNCGNQNCSSNQTCIGTSYDNSAICLQKGVGQIGSYCGNLNKFPNNDACTSGFCGSDLRCSENLPPVNSACQQAGGSCIPMAPCAPPSQYDSSFSCGNGPYKVCCIIPAPVWQQIAVCPAATATPTPNRSATPTTAPTKNLFTCIDQTGPAEGKYQCAAIVNGAVQCPTGYGNYSLDTKYDGISCGANQGCCKQGSVFQGDIFSCQNQTTGSYVGEYACAEILNDAVQCQTGYTNFAIPGRYIGTSCGLTRGCCKKNVIPPTSTPNPTHTPTPTPLPSNTCAPSDCGSLCAPGFACTQNASSPTKSCSCQSTTPTTAPTPTAGPVANTNLTFIAYLPELIASPTRVTRNISVEIFDTTTNAKVSEGVVEGTYNPITQRFIATRPAKWIPVTGYYNVKMKVPGYLKTLISSQPIAVGQTISLPTTLQPGDITGDNLVDIRDYQNLAGCFGAKFDPANCSNGKNADLNNDGVVNGLDYNIFFKALTFGKRVGD